MSERNATLKPAVHGHRAEVEEQLWPTVCATLVLVGVVGVIIWNNSDFDEDRLLLNGYTHLVALAAAAGLLVFIASRLKGTARRTAELAIVASLAFHAVAGIGAFYVFSRPLVGPSRLEAVRDAEAESDDEPPPPDYHWGQNDEPETEQAFEQSLATKLRDQAPPAAQLPPRDRDRTSPVAAITRVPKVEITPLGAAADAAPSKPLDIRRPEAAKIEEAKTPEALAMVRQKADEPPLPKSEPPVAMAMPAAPKEPPKSPEPAGVQAEKSEAASPAKAAEANNEAIAPRGQVQPSEALPATDIVARLPSQTPPQPSNDPSGPEAADRITQQGSTQERTDRGVPLPSTVIPDAGLPAQSPAAPGSSLPSRLEAVSTIPVEKSDTSQAPPGATIASRGNQDFAAGSSLSPSRQGAVDGRGRAQPSLASDAAEDPAESRLGAPGSNLTYGPSLPSAPARRAVASQTDEADSGASASQAARLPRTQSNLGLKFPALAKIAESPTAAGAGGTANRPGGQTSTLDVGQQIAIRRSAGPGTPDDNSHGAGTAGPGAGDTLPGNDVIARGSVATAVGSGPSGPRRMDQRTLDGDDNALGGIPRARSDVNIPHPMASPVGSVAGSANGLGGASSLGTPQGSGTSVIGPNAGLGGIERRETFGQGAGVRPSGPVESSELASRSEVTSPQPLRAAGHGGRGDGPLDQILVGDGSGLGGISRGNSQIMVSGQVHEPMEPFRRGPVRGGLAVGDSVAGQLTEPAIENGLEYLSHTQFSDGHWSLHELPGGPVADPASLGSLHADTAATGLALLTYLGAGYTHQDEKYRDLIRRGVDWLMKHQQPDGNLSFQDSDATHYYSHGIATMALCEAYGMTQDRELREPAQKAIDFIVKSQDPRRGGWRYLPRDGSDTSVTGWQLMALKSAQMAGLDVPEQTLSKVGHWLDLAQVPNRGTYVYNPWNLDTDLERMGRAPSPTMTAQAMIMRMYLGQDRGNASIAQGADYLLGHMPDESTQQASYRDCYYWYYATQAMYHMQGDYWKAWDARVTPLVRAEQIDRGPLKGSWSPREPALDRWSREGGRHYVTAMHVLTLEFRYWHLPLFRELRKD